MTRPAPRLDHDVVIALPDLDATGQVNHAVYLTWVQGAVIAHWRRFAPPLILPDFLWVAVTHEIEYRRPVFAGDAIHLSVVCEAVKGPRAFYRSHVVRRGTMLAEIRSSWCCLDAATHRPARLPADVVALFVGT